MALSVRQIEDDIQIHAWGRWARPRLDRMLGVRSAPWVDLLRAGSGWPAPAGARDYAPRAPEEHCERLDRMIASMGPQTVAVLVALYCYGRSLNDVARQCRLSNRKVMQIRDCALNMLYGALYLKNIA